SGRCGEEEGGGRGAGGGRGEEGPGGAGRARHDGEGKAHEEVGAPVGCGGHGHGLGTVSERVDLGDHQPHDRAEREGERNDVDRQAEGRDDGQAGCSRSRRVGAEGECQDPVAFVFHDSILRLLLRRLPAQAGSFVALGGGHRIAVTGVSEAFAIVLKLSLAAGIALATPVWLYHLWAFVAPALRGAERRYALPFTGLGVILFVTGLGVAFATFRYPLHSLPPFT